MLKVKRSGDEKALNLKGNGEVLKSEEKALMINEELLTDNERVLQVNEEALNGNEKAY